MIKALLTTLIIFSFCYPSFSVELAELESETAEELLLFFEEEELTIATRHKTPVKKAPAIATVITAKEIRNMGARNLMDVLKRMPGIGISIANFTIMPALEVRGIRTDKSEKILFMLDGHRLNSPLNGTAFMYFNDIPVENIKRIEVMRGPGSALYGANAFLAVVNIVTKGVEDIKVLQITAGGGSFDTQHYNLLFGHDKEKLKITGHLDYLDTDGASSYIEQDTDGISGHTLEWKEKTDIGINVIYEDITFRGRYIRKKAGPYIGISNALNDETVQDYQIGLADLAYYRKLTDIIDLKVRLYGDITVNDPLWEQRSEGFYNPKSGYTYTDGMLGNPSATGRTLGSEVMMDYKLPNHLLTTGIMYEDERQYDTGRSINFDPYTFEPTDFHDVTETGNYTKDISRDIWAVYMQDVWSITGNASLTAGIRHDHYSDFGGTTNPRAGLVWEFLEDTSLKLLYGSAFRSPYFDELYYFNNPVYGGNPDLEPEEIKTYEAGLEHRFLKKHTARLNYFYNNISNLIVFGPKPGPTQPRVYENRSSAEVQGIELELLSDFDNDNYGYFNYSYQNPRDGDTDERLPDVPSHRANAGINLAPWKYLNANVNVSWTGKRPRAEGDTRDDLSSLTLVDLTLIAKKFYQTLEIRGSVYNLFNEDYRDPSPYNPGNPVTIPVPNDYPTNGRMFLIEARYTF
jgi:iron complex outermembrane receptor protein